MQPTLLPQTQQLLFEVDGYTAEMCIEQESLETAFRLRYRAYLEADAIPPNSEKQFYDSFDSQQNARTFLIHFEGKPVASIRSLTWSADYNWAPTPSVNFFRAEIDQELGADTPLLESNRFVVDPSFQGRKSLTAQMLLFRVQTLGSIADSCEHVITAVRPKHVRFYERFMNFHSISVPISVPEVSFPIQLLSTPVSSREKLSENSKLASFAEADLTNYINCLQKVNA